MSEFTKQPLEEIVNPYFKLYKVLEDGKSFYDEFVDSLSQPADLNAMDAIRAIMDRLDNTILSSTIINHIRGSKSDRNDVYEFKRHNVRIYFIMKKPDFLLLLGGFKSNQKKDLKKVFRHFNNLPDYIPDYDPR